LQANNTLVTSRTTRRTRRIWFPRDNFMFFWLFFQSPFHRSFTVLLCYWCLDIYLALVVT